MLTEVARCEPRLPDVGRKIFSPNSLEEIKKILIFNSFPVVLSNF